MLLNRPNWHGPFDIVGDVHGCLDELLELLSALGYQMNRRAGDLEVALPLGRRLVFVGDLVNRGPATSGVVRLVMNMAREGQALCVPGNRDMKLPAALKDRSAFSAAGLTKSLEQLANEPAEFRAAAVEFLDALPSHCILDDGKLVIAHAGLPEHMRGSDAPRARAFAIGGETTGETDEFGLLVRCADLVQFCLSGLCRFFGGTQGRLQAKLSRGAALHRGPGTLKLRARGAGFSPDRAAFVLSLILVRCLAAEPLVRLGQRAFQRLAILDQAHQEAQQPSPGEDAEALQHKPGLADPLPGRLHGKAELKVLRADRLLHCIRDRQIAVRSDSYRFPAGGSRGEDCVKVTLLCQVFYPRQGQRLRQAHGCRHKAPESLPSITSRDEDRQPRHNASLPTIKRERSGQRESALLDRRVGARAEPVGRSPD